MKLLGLDHIVITVESIETTIRFYRDILGFEEVTFGGGRKALKGGSQKINIHKSGEEFCPHAKSPAPGSSDICLLYNSELHLIIDHLIASGIEIEEGPVDRTGALGPIESVYIRDPDANLIELSVQK